VTKEEFLTVRWNNVLTLGLGLVFVLYAIFASSSSAVSDGAAFAGLMVLGVVY
jgi:hypothetical protein